MKKITVCGIPYRIKFVDGVKDSQDNSILWGQISYRDRIIKIDKNSTPEHKRQTFMHELIHGVIEGMSIRELIDDKGKHSEIPICQLAVGLANALSSCGLKIPVE